MGFELPVEEDEDLGPMIPSLTRKGLVVKDETIPYLEIEEFKATSKTDLVIIFKDKERADLELDIAEKSGHILLSLPHMIHAWMCMEGVAELDESRQNITNGPKFNFKKIAKTAKEAYAYGA